MLVYQLSFGALLLASWQLASGRLVRELFFSSPLAVAERLYQDLVVERTVWFHLQVTLTEFGIGYAIGASSAIFVGVLLGRSRFLSMLLQPFLLGFYAIPKSALAPIFIVWFGLDLASKVAMVTLFTFFLVFVQTYSGIRSIDEHLVNLARLMGASKLMIIRRIMFPSAAPDILLGLRTGIPYGMIGAVIGEYIASNRGIGYVIYRSAAQFDIPGVFAGIAVLVATVMLLTNIIARLERRAIRWMPQPETQVTL